MAVPVCGRRYPQLKGTFSTTLCRAPERRKEPLRRWEVGAGERYRTLTQPLSGSHNPSN